MMAPCGDASRLVRLATGSDVPADVVGGPDGSRALVRPGCGMDPWRAGRPCAYAIGAFDGVHLGHRALVASCVEHAREAGVACAAVLFDPDPSRVLSPDHAEPELLCVADRARMLLSLGLDAVVTLPFDEARAATPYDEFVTRDLAAIAPVESLHVGADFRLGAGGAGDVAALSGLGATAGFLVEAHGLVDHGGSPVTSTRIRGLLARGDVRAAAELLGRCHVVRGGVAHGRGEGTGMGFPTANVVPSAQACLPADGVYGCYVRVGDDAWPAAVNVGRPRSFEMPPGSPERLLEANLMGFSGDLYGDEVEVVLVEWLRAPRAFPSVAELERVVGENIAWVRENLGTGRVGVSS